MGERSTSSSARGEPGNRLSYSLKSTGKARNVWLVRMANEDIF